MNRIEKALKIMEELNYQATIVNDKLYVTAWNKEQSDSADFQVSEEEIDKYAAEYNTKKRAKLLRDVQHDLQLTYDTIHYSGNEGVFKAEWHQGITFGMLLENIAKCVNKMSELESSNQKS